MKKAISIMFWVFSAALALMALALLSASALSCTLLLGCAVLINPLFVEKIQLKKSITALLAIGLFIASVAVFPASRTAAEQTAAESAAGVRAMPAEASVLPERTQKVTKELKLIEDADTPEETASASPTSVPITATPTLRPTPTSRPSPTSTQTPYITPKPTPVPTPTQTIALKTRAEGITIVDYSETVRRGSFAFIEISGMPNTDYTCDVEYKSGMSTADGLGTKRSDANGRVSWRWKVGTRTSLNYTPTIYIDGGGDSISVDFEVTG